MGKGASAAHASSLKTEKKGTVAGRGGGGPGPAVRLPDRPPHRQRREMVGAFMLWSRQARGPIPVIRLARRRQGAAPCRRTRLFSPAKAGATGRPAQVL